MQQIWTHAKLAADKEMQTERERLDEERTELNDRHAEMLTVSEDQEAQIELLQAELERSRQEAIELRAKHEGLQAELAEAKTEVSVLIERCAQLERSLSDAKELESHLIAQFAKT